MVDSRRFNADRNNLRKAHNVTIALDFLPRSQTCCSQVHLALLIQHLQYNGIPIVA